MGKGFRHLQYGQSLGLGDKPNRKVQKVSGRSHENEKGVRLSVLQQDGKGKGHQPVSDPVDKDANRHGRISGVEWEYFGNNEPSDTTRAKGKEDDDSRGGYDG